MKNKYYLGIVLILLIISVTTGVLFYMGRNEENIHVGTEIGEKAPDFTLPLINNEEISLSDLRGKKVFLNFWATWCPPCQIEMPAIQKLNDHHDFIEILAVDLRENRDTVSEYLMKNSYNFRVALDTSAEIGNKYLVRGIPTSYFIDENGVIMNKHTGALSYQKMLELLRIE
ncbi:TlpA disulfide reductase family protein [Halocella sp. SP3-1]|uniref:TlpA family protein disulfide reductase n=1 Tax=Halocella sp. SP3-1 TaxID=2382161 RepID=UPI000F75CC23|nr:TlpA disulfide reductase family protein [Halocella sp. SP3-1]AZO93894.1 TlpA family protein disulfide reductase [Halocella sp. SP3-1]